MIDVIPGFRFKADIQLFDKTIPVHFSEISGLTVTVDTETVKEGGQNEYIQKLPSYPQYANLILKKAISLDQTLHNWIATSITTSDYSPVTITITLLGETQQPLLSWMVVGAYPVKWETSALQADQNNLVIETLELAYQQFFSI